jgi:hypothetical protein
VSKIINIHSHDSEAASIKANVAITKIKKRSPYTLESLTSIINECPSGLSQVVKLGIYIFFN